ncbi:hypothetical protein MTP10_28200 [Nonomuraea sp. 3-1Str]|uniref:hypothetical protein n=1 Tax=Nonomuraea sp. 3-1Str TaxID=2929801 RepID=UPI0028567555|nr:hypothetical protein [Nonomuraea sp. 3-1Str]MDR8412598.1 hypothetical protein [Nonomuraea sp. 3-1Str]
MLKVRVTGVLIEDERILLLDQDTDTGRSWSLPGGTRTGGSLGAADGADTRPIRGVRFVPVSDLPSLGFSRRFTELAQAGFPGAGSYMGAKSTIGL